MPNAIRVDFTHPANREILAYMGAVVPGAATLAPDEVHWYRLGTHPDLVEYLWKLPGSEMSCACVIEGVMRPLLAHPSSGVIFGLAGGTGTLAMRLPDPERAAALGVPGYGAQLVYPSGTTHAADMGGDWVLLRPFDAENGRLCRRALEHARALART